MTYLRTIFLSQVALPLFFFLIFSGLDMVRYLVSNVVDIKVPYYIIDFSKSGIRIQLVKYCFQAGSSAGDAVLYQRTSA